MATSNYKLAQVFHSQFPHTFNALQSLVMTMDKYYKVRNKSTIFGRDRGLKAFKKFEAQLKNSLYALVLDNVVSRNASASSYYENLMEMIASFMNLFPNWQDGYAFATEYFINNKDESIDRIKKIMEL